MTESEARPQVVIEPIEVSLSADRLWREFASTNAKDGDPRKPHTVARFGHLCRFGRDDATNSLELRLHDKDTMRDQLTHHVAPVSLKVERERVCGQNKSNSHAHSDDCFETSSYFVPAKLPDEIIQALLKRPLDRLDEDGHVPRIDRIIDVPVFAPDGTLISEYGYHEDARLYYDGVPMAGITQHWDDRATRAADVEAARHFLMEDLLGDFPFADDSSKAHALAMIVEQFARGMIDGPAPAYTVIASEQGTGKSLLAKACLAPACGRVVAHPEPEENGSDFQKRLVSLLLAAPEAILFDNVTRRLENSTLAAMLTSGRYADRVLGKSQILTFPVRHTTVFTMNNPEIGPDMRRRVVPIYLDAGVERPWERPGPWRHSDLLGWADRNRPRLVGAALTLVANWAYGWTAIDHEGEEYTQRATPPRMMGTFEEWSRVIGGIVTAAGVRGFGDNIHTLYADQSEDDSEEARFLGEWPQGARLTADQIRRWVTVGLSEEVILPATEPPPGLRDRYGKVTPQSIGNGLRDLRGKVRDGRRLLNDRQPRITQWYVEEV